MQNKVTLRKFNGAWRVEWTNTQGEPTIREFKDRKEAREFISWSVNRDDLLPLPWQALDEKSEFTIWS